MHKVKYISMNIAFHINEEFVEELQNETMLRGKALLKLSFELLIYLKEYLTHFILSFAEFSPSQLREKGLGEILFQRALRFFKMEALEDKAEKGIERIKISRKRIQKKGRCLLKRSCKVILFPFYLLILLFLLPGNSSISKHKRQNVYKE